MSRPKNLPRDENAPSKTQLKKEMIALQDLGETLTTLSKDQLAQLDLPEGLRDALDELSRVGKHEARRRHMQYIGKWMREVDPAPIRAQIDRWEAGTRANKAAFKSAELWRDRLLSEQGALDQLLELKPEFDRDAIAKLIAAAHDEARMEKAPKSSRALFREIHRVMLKLEP